MRAIMATAVFYIVGGMGKDFLEPRAILLWLVHIALLQLLNQFHGAAWLNLRKVNMYKEIIFLFLFIFFSGCEFKKDSMDSCKRGHQELQPVYEYKNVNQHWHVVCDEKFPKGK